MPWVKPPRCDRPVGDEQCLRNAGHPGDCTGLPTLAQVLTFEAAHPNHDGPKEDLIGTQFHIRPVRYYQLLNKYIATREALEYDAVTVNRVKRMRDDRQAARSSRNLHRQITPHG